MASNEMPVQASMLDTVLKKTVSAVEQSKLQIFDITENARSETMQTSLELAEIRAEVKQTIDRTDELERLFRGARQRLVEVSRDFHRFAEADIRSAYEMTSQLQVELSLSREKEQNLRRRRDDLERRLRNLREMIGKAENLMTQIGAVLGFLTGDLGSLSSALESAQQRQLFGAKIIQAQEEERKRVARDIHDGPAQSMAHVVLQSDLAEKLLNQNKIEDAKIELRSLKETVRNTLSDVRKIIFDLRPMALDDLGLVPTLRKYMEEYENRYQLATEFTIFGREQRLAAPQEVAVFRLIQEALHNIRKHAKARRAQVKLDFQPKSLTVIVQDDGIGFEQDLEHTELEHFGMMGMKERIQLLGGKLEIESVKGRGTKVWFIIPLSS
jgi:two-component system, NarL family, sensor histidine kinase DegS